MRFLSALCVALFLGAPALLIATAAAQPAGPTHELRASGEVLPLRRGYDPAELRYPAPDSIVYDDRSAWPDDFLGFGGASPFYAATRFTAGAAFTLTSIRVAYSTFGGSGAIFVWIFAGDGSPTEPGSGTLLFSAQGTNPAPDGTFAQIGLSQPLPFQAGASFFVVVGFPDVPFPMGTDANGSGNYAGRMFFSGSGDDGSWTALGDILQDGQPDAWVLRALGETGGGGGGADIAVVPGSLSASVSAGGRTTLPLTISNTGTGALNWTASASSAAQPRAPGAGPLRGRQTPASAIAPTPTAPDAVLALLRRRARAGGTARVIVELALPTPFRVDADLGRAGAARQEAAIAAAGAAVTRRLGAGAVSPVRTYTSVPYLAVEVDAAGLEALAADPDVVRLHEDRWAEASLAESTQVIGAPQAWQAGFTGAGQTVAVLDNGSAVQHAFLGGRTIGEACFSTPSPAQGVQSLCPNGQPTQSGPGAAAPCSIPEVCDHGTHVAGIAVGAGSQFSGVAPQASLVAVQVFVLINNPQICGQQNPCVRTSTSDQLGALQWIYQNRTQASFASINMSLGGGRFMQHCDSEPLKPIIDQLRAAGIATVIASGNEGFTDSISAPACISSAVSVGSTGDGSGGATLDVVSNFSNSASILSLLAPGADITSSTVGGGFGPLQGTSMAAPHVAGAWAVLRQQRPSASVSELLARLQQTGRPIVDGGNGLTFARIQLDAAVGGGSGSGWLSVSPTSGTTPAGGQSTLTVTLDAATLGAGTYNGVVSIASNDPDQPTVTVPVTLTVSGGGGGGSVLTHVRPGDPQMVFASDNGGFVHGTNGYGDLAKAVAFTPAGPATLTGVGVYFNQRAPAPQLQQYTVRIYSGTEQAGPQGSPLHQQTFTVAGMQDDGDPNTPSPGTPHVLSSPVPLSGPFFVSVEYDGPYGNEDFNIASTDRTGAPSPYEWEKWSDGTWHNMSEAWTQNADGWHMWIEAQLDGGVATEDGGALPERVTLAPSFPNPLRDAATIRFALPAAGPAALAVYDALGRRVATLAEGPHAAGTHAVTWDARAVAAGVYVYRLTAAGAVETRKLTVVR